MDILIGKTGKHVAVDFTALPENVRDYVVRYGLTQCLNDAHSGETVKGGATPDTIMAVVEKKLDAMKNGIVRVSSGRTGDPVRAEALRLATNAVKQAIRGQGKKASAYTPAQYREAAIKLLATPNGEALTEIAEANVVAAREAGADIEI